MDPMDPLWLIDDFPMKTDDFLMKTSIRRGVGGFFSAIFRQTYGGFEQQVSGTSLVPSYGVS